MLWFLLQSCSVILSSFFKCSFYHLAANWHYLPFTFSSLFSESLQKDDLPLKHRFSVLSIQLLKIYYCFVLGIIFIYYSFKTMFWLHHTTCRISVPRVCVCVCLVASDSVTPMDCMYVCVQSCLTLWPPWTADQGSKLGTQQWKCWVLTTGSSGNSLIYSFYVKILFFSFKFPYISYL